MSRKRMRKCSYVMFALVYIMAAVVRLIFALKNQNDSGLMPIGWLAFFGILLVRDFAILLMGYIPVDAMIEAMLLRGKDADPARFKLSLITAICTIAAIVLFYISGDITSPTANTVIVYASYALAIISVIMFIVNRAINRRK